MNDKYDYLQSITYETVKDKLPPRPHDAHKGVFGKLLCVCGSRPMPGAADFVISAAVKCGTGLVKGAVPKSIYEIIAKKISEVTFIICEENEDGFISSASCSDILKEAAKCSAVVIGCGMGWNSDTKTIVYNLIKNCTVPIIIDADGINTISENIDILKEAKSSVIITPHPREMSRLTGIAAEEINVNKLKYAKDFSLDYGVTTILKGCRTIICSDDGRAFVNTTGNEGMAKGGSGDVLAGMIGSFLAQGISPCEAAVCAVFIHGMAGDICKSKFSSVSMTPSDIVNELPDLFLQFER